MARALRRRQQAGPNLVWLGAALLLIAINLRAPIAAIGPMVDDVRDGLGMSNSTVGLLTTLPLLCFGLAAVLGPIVERLMGADAALLAAVLVLVAGTALRLLDQIPPFIAGTIVLGIGIAVANVLIPTIIKRHFPRPGTMMGLYAMVLSGGAALVAGVTVPLEHALGSWLASLAIWGPLALLSAVAWLPAVLASRNAERVAPPRPVRLWGDRGAWLLTGLFGLQSMLFYTGLAWIPDILQDTGESPGHAGAMLSVALVLGIPAAFVASSIAARTHDQRPLATALAGAFIVGITGLLTIPTTATPAWMAMLGIAAGGLFSLSLALIVLRSPDGAHATSLSGMVQGVGYVMSALGPLAIGVLHDLSGGWTVPLVAMVACGVVTLVVGLGAGRPGMIGISQAELEPEPELEAASEEAAPAPLSSPPAAASSCISAGTDARSSS